MRVPLPIAIILSLIVIGVVWWRGTAGIDFLTPPSDAELAAIRNRVEMSLPQANLRDDAISVPDTPPPLPEPVVIEKPPEPEIDLGDLSSAPGLSAYAEFGEKGSSYLIELASLLESEGQFQRALLAWERVLDSTDADPAQAAAAMAAARRLRPTLPDWNVDPQGAVSITLHAGTGKKLAASLEPILAQVAKDIGRASSGILAVEISVASGTSSLDEDGPTPVAMWISGTGEGSSSTDVLSFTVKDLETVEPEVMRTVILLVRNHFEKSRTLTAPTVPPRDEPARTALELRVTRLSWQSFGRALGPPAPATQ